MKKFWEWMVKKGYCTSYYNLGCRDIFMIKDQFNSDVRPTKHMLYGYYTEYLIDNHKNFEDERGEFMSGVEAAEELIKELENEAL